MAERCVTPCMIAAADQHPRPTPGSKSSTSFPLAFRVWIMEGVPPATVRNHLPAVRPLALSIIARSHQFRRQRSRSRAVKAGVPHRESP
jgi:hypothetical protein